MPFISDIAGYKGLDELVSKQIAVGCLVTGRPGLYPGVLLVHQSVCEHLSCERQTHASTERQHGP
jgi:hypothetical protein